MFNRCSCNIGYTYSPNNTDCVLIDPTQSNPSDFNKVVKNMPYLPRNIHTGVYYYSTVINNEIYSLALNCNFKFDGDKWVEIPKLNLQTGFNPYIPSDPMSKFGGNFVSLNSGLTCVVDTKIYVVAPSTYALQVQLNSPSNSLYCFDTVSGIWMENIFGNFPDTSASQGSVVLVSFILNGVLYVIMSKTVPTLTNVYTFNLSGGYNGVTQNLPFTIMSNSRIVMSSAGRIFLSFVKTSTTVNLFGELTFDTTGKLSFSPLNSVVQNLPQQDWYSAGGYSTFLLKDRYLFSVYAISYTDRPIISYIDITQTGSSPKILNIVTSSIPISGFFNSVLNGANVPIIQSYDKYYGCVSHFIVSDNVFFVNGIGDIISLLITYDNSGGIVSGYFVPCYGIPKYDTPLIMPTVYPIL